MQKNGLIVSRKAVKRRTHRERAQPAARQKYGLLEKHKDYVERAKNFHRKEDRIKALRERATLRNPDEFYFGMEHAQTKNGIHDAGTENMKRAKARGKEAEKTMKVQDGNWIMLQASKNKSKIDALKESIHFLETSQEQQPKHTIFVEDEEELETFDPAKHFQTLPELLPRKFNRPKVDVNGDLLDIPEVNVALSDINHAKQVRCKELRLRLEAHEKLEKMRRETDLGKQMMTKGAKIKVGVDGQGVAVYKWRNERKK
jgi:U3 small nucleolar RNA-associated protein 11